jgi:ATP-dependent 26S proteasome regulatory subunit
MLNVLLFQSRFDILKIHSRKMNLMRGIDLKKIAEKMNGASGAELKVCFFFTHNRQFMCI